MDVDVVEVEGGMGQRGVSDDGEIEPNESAEANNAENSSAHGDDDGIMDPYVGMEFHTEDAAKTFYDEYARRVGFSSKVCHFSRPRPDEPIVFREFVCGREGLKRRHGESCDAMLRIELKGQNKWVVTKFVKEHSHPMVSPSKVHYLRPRRHFAGTTKAEVYQGVGIVPSGIMYVSMDGNRATVETNNRGARTATPVETRTAPPIESRTAPPVESRTAPPIESRTAPPIEQYERALENSFEREIEADFDTICTTPRLRTPSPMERQAANSFTRKVFTKFQEEEGWKKVAVVKKNVAKVPPPGSHVSGTGYDDRKISASPSDSTPLLWPRQDEMTRRFNLNDSGPAIQPVSDLNLPRMAPVSLHRDDGPSDNMVVLPCLKSMTWVMENKNSAPGNRVAVINLKLHDYSKTPSAELEVKFQLSKVTLEPMLRSMAYISDQLSTPANRVAVINLKLQDTETISGESEVKFQVSRDTLGAMLRSMAYIREQLSNT
ncbi:hypothetical protein CUMW_129940, partial [Citrus unshiu]